MAVSRTYNFVFVHVPKCAGTSIEHALKRSGPLELMTPGVFHEREAERRGFSLTGTVHGLERHLAAREIKSTMAERDWDACFRFAVVRCPYARLVSFYHFVKRLKSPDETKLQVRLVLGTDSFRDFFLQAAENEQMQLFFNQWMYLHDEAGHCLMDLVVPLEAIGERFSEVLQGIYSNPSLPLWKRWRLKYGRFGSTKLPALNVTAPSKAIDYRTYYDDTILEIANRLFEKDLQLYGYRPLQ